MVSIPVLYLSFQSRQRTVRKIRDDWRECLRESFECLNRLLAEADRLKAGADRYIRPICLVQVERTGKDQRESGFIHADAVREYLLTLGVREQEIAIKTSEKNELKDPENIDLLSSACQVRFIITKQALQEGWDCPFAYVLCSLAPTTNKSAMTQLAGRILRQPDTIKTGMAPLDECHVICFHATTKEIVQNIKAGLEQEGMADLSDAIREWKDGDGSKRPEQRKMPRRDTFKGTKIFLPVINRVDGATVRPLDIIPTNRIAESRQLYREDGKVVEKSLFSPSFMRTILTILSNELPVTLTATKQ